MSQILEGAMERIYGTQEDGKLEQEIGRRMKLRAFRWKKYFSMAQGERNGRSIWS